MKHKKGMTRGGGKKKKKEKATRHHTFSLDVVTLEFFMKARPGKRIYA